MDIEDEIAELEKTTGEVAEATEEEIGQQVGEEIEEEAEAESGEEEVEAKTEEKAEEKAETAEDKAPEDAPDNSAFAKLRIEKKKAEQTAADWQSKYEELNSKIQQLEASQSIQTQETEEPQQPTEAQILARKIAERDIYQSAEAQFQYISNEFSKNTPDYNAAIGHALAKERMNMKNMHPDVPDYLIDQQLKKDLLMRASFYVNKGYNPAEALYAHAIDYYGYQPPSSNNSKPKTDLKRIEENKKRSTTIIDKGSSGKKVLSADAIGSLSLEDLENTSQEEINTAISMG